MTPRPAPKDQVDRFRLLHRKGAAFIIPNFWDAGSARILEGLGFSALASTSSGFALTKGRADYGVTRDEALAHCREAAGAVDVPVSADLENGFGPRAEDCAETVRLAALTGLCGGSIEDTTGDTRNPIAEKSLAVERIAAAVEAARAALGGFVLTARADGLLHGAPALDDIIARLQAFEAAGADVLFAPGLPDLDAVKAVCASVSRPVNVLVYGRLAEHSVDEFAEAGVARLSLGGALAGEAYAALVEIASAVSQSGRFKVLGQRREAAAKLRSIIRA
ncbi:MAG: isocitrate lyase/phosphoenolpyruvate mutase family protein [Parvularculaceae bacterium]